MEQLPFSEVSHPMGDPPAIPTTKPESTRSFNCLAAISKRARAALCLGCDHRSNTIVCFEPRESGGNPLPAAISTAHQDAAWRQTQFAYLTPFKRRIRFDLKFEHNRLLKIRRRSG